MAVNSGFFPAKNNDRVYDGYDLGGMFEGLITDGVFRDVGEALEVTEGPDFFKFNVRVKTGKAWLQKTYLYNTSMAVVKVGGGDGINVGANGTAYIIIEHDEDGRENRFKAVKTVPTDENVLVLAKVETDSNGNISQANITNLRGTSQCPFIVGILKTLSADDILAQWRAQFDKFMKESKTTFTNFIDKVAPGLVKKRVDELWNVLEISLRTQWNNWFDRNTKAFEKAWNDWYNTNTKEYEKAWNDWYNSHTAEYDSTWNAWYNESTRYFTNMWNDWYNTNTKAFKAAWDKFEAQWDTWWHNMTDGKEEALEKYWDEHQKHLTSLMIQQWWEWYHPFVDEKEAEFANWQAEFEEKTDQVTIDYQQFADYVNEKTQEVTDISDDFKDHVVDKQDAVDKETFNALERIKDELGDFYDKVDSLGFYTIPYVSSINDSSEGIILDSNNDPLLALNHVLVL